MSETPTISQSGNVISPTIEIPSTPLDHIADPIIPAISPIHTLRDEGIDIEDHESPLFPLTSCHALCEVQNTLSPTLNHVLSEHYHSRVSTGEAMGHIGSLLMAAQDGRSPDHPSTPTLKVSKPKLMSPPDIPRSPTSAEKALVPSPSLRSSPPSPTSEHIHTSEGPETLLASPKAFVSPLTSPPLLPRALGRMGLRAEDLSALQRQGLAIPSLCNRRRQALKPTAESERELDMFAELERMYPSGLHFKSRGPAPTGSRSLKVPLLEKVVCEDIYGIPAIIGHLLVPAVRSHYRYLHPAFPEHPAAFPNPAAQLKELALETKPSGALLALEQGAGPEGVNTVTIAQLRAFYDEYLLNRDPTQRFFTCLIMPRVAAEAEDDRRNAEKEDSTTSPTSESPLRLIDRICPASASGRVPTPSVQRDDLLRLMGLVLRLHPGLDFLAATPEFQVQYAVTVVERILFELDRTHKNCLTLSDIRRSDLVEATWDMQRQKDINQCLRFYSYEHFYVLYCLGEDMQLLTDQGYMFLDQFAAAWRDGEGSVLVAGYDQEAGELVYERPDALIVNASKKQTMVEFTEQAGRVAGSSWWDQQTADAVEGVHHCDQVSVLVTPEHDMFARTDAPSPYRKVTAGELHAALHSGDMEAVRFTSIPGTGVASPTADTVSTETVLRAPDVCTVPYEGRTWCVTMPHGLIWTRRARRHPETGAVTVTSRACLTGNCRFWELDTDHDQYVTEVDVLKYAGESLNPRMVHRVFQQIPRAFHPSTPAGKMSYVDFIPFLLAEEDKDSDAAIEYWFAVADVDGDGLVGPRDFAFFYTAQVERLRRLGHEAALLEDVRCQMIDMAMHTQRAEGLDGFGAVHISLKDVRRCKTPGNLFNVLFNLNKLMQFEARDPYTIRYPSNALEKSAWDRFARLTYDMLAAEEEGDAVDDYEAAFGLEPDGESMMMDSFSGLDPEALS
eukprot:gnl/Dysnectes_brevis/5462_a7866_308.p1 GENE.gnl/Dysnectes_brevis/5462_a7866_308~~gnl/Dysnectes_brevis/5462_a7866_308.p1  ORF type:complete len:956 (+),score=409.09 gnl/Dysnectes_brevis/5462_a7866_308:40-2907(+)